ncbi:hypothetical protein EV128_125132 [Rhizobium azibense]|nr:hypothetical protein EV128_125132 [Rhizobium azibense]
MEKLIAIGLVAVLLGGCDQRPQQPQPTRTFADEDECEDAGMSDAFCDNLFPEFEDFFDKKKKSKPAAKPVTKPAKPKPSSSSRSTKK